MNWSYLIAFTFIQLSHTSTVTFTPSTNNPGLIFQQQKNIYLAHDEWKLVYYYDLTQFYQESRKIISIKSTMIRLCDKLKQNLLEETQHICTYILNQLNIHEEHTNTRDNIIKSFETTKERSRRAPVEIVGTAAKYLFGILDSESAKEYEKNINTLKSNQSFISELTKKQTTLIEGLITLHNTTISEVQTQLIAVNTYIRKMEEKTSNQGEKIHTSTHFNSLASSITLTLMHHEELSNKIYNLLTNTIHGKITDVIPPIQLKINIREIGKHLKNNIILPTNVENENIYEIFKYTSIKSILHQNKIIIEFSIPLVDNEQFIFYKTTPIPINNKTNCIIIRTKNTHFFTDTHHKTFIPADKNSLKNCINTNTKIICKMDEIFSNTGRICELLLLDDTNIKNIPEECDIASIANKNYILKTSPNNFYLSTTKPYTVRTNCEEITKNININTNGYITIDPGCTVVSSFFKIKQPTVKQQINHIEIAPELDFNFNNFNETNHTKKLETSYTIHDHNKDFKFLIDKTRELKKLEAEQNTSNLEILTHTFSISTAITIVAAIIFIFYIYNAYIKRHIHRSTIDTSTPAAATHEGETATHTTAATIQYT